MTKTLELVEEFDAELVEVDARLAFSIKRDVLAEYLSRILPVIPTKETIPGSSLVSITAHLAQKGALAYLTLYATNGEQQVLFDIDAPRVLKEGSVNVPARKLQDLIKLAPKKWVHIQVVGSTMYVRSGNVRWVIQADSNNRTPRVSPEDTIPIEIPRWEFLNALRIVLSASPDSSARESLQQVQFKDGFATVCDGTRLHRKQIKEFPGNVNFNLQIPAAKLLVRAMAKAEVENITVEISKTALLFDVGSEKFITQRTILPFPNLEGLFLAPAIRNEYTLSVERLEFIDSISRVKINSDPMSATIALEIVNGAKGKHFLSITARDLGNNSSEENIQCQWFGPAKYDTMYVHYRKFLDLLQSTTDEYVFLKLGDNPAKGQKSPVYLNDPDAGLTVVLQQKLAS